MRRSAAQALQEAHNQLGADATEEAKLDLARRLVKMPLPDPMGQVRMLTGEVEHKAKRALQTLREADRPGIKAATRRVVLARAQELLGEVRLALVGASSELEQLTQEEADHG